MRSAPDNHVGLAVGPPVAEPVAQPRTGGANGLAAGSTVSTSATGSTVGSSAAGAAPGLPAAGPTFASPVAGAGPGLPAPGPTVGLPAAAGLVPATPQPSSGSVAPGPAAAAPQSPPEVPEQLTRAVLPLTASADGSFALSLRLHPAELGEVRLDVRVLAGTVDVAVHTASEAARSAVQGAIEQLRGALSDAGLTPGSLDVSTGDGRGGNAEAHLPPGGADEPSPSDEIPAVADPDLLPSTVPTGTLDLRL